jgi:hypothetical protein
MMNELTCNLVVITQDAGSDMLVAKMVMQGN